MSVSYRERERESDVFWFFFSGHSMSIRRGSEKKALAGNCSRVAYQTDLLLLFNHYMRFLHHYIIAFIETKNNTNDLKYKAECITIDTHVHGHAYDCFYNTARNMSNHDHWNVLIGVYRSISDTSRKYPSIITGETYDRSLSFSLSIIISPPPTFRLIQSFHHRFSFIFLCSILVSKNDNVRSAWKFIKFFVCSHSNWEDALNHRA